MRRFERLRNAFYIREEQKQKDQGIYLALQLVRCVILENRHFREILPVGIVGANIWEQELHISEEEGLVVISIYRTEDERSNELFKGFGFPNSLFLRQYLFWT